jgi:hypothetical protein
MSSDLPTYTANRTTSPITIDGHLDEHSWSTAPWTADLINILGSAHPAPPHRTRCKILYDDKTLYIAAELDDPHIAATMTEPNSPVWKENCFELFLDPAGTGTNYWEIEINARNTVWSLLMPKPYSAGGKPMKDKHLPNLKTATQITGTLNDSSDTDTKWTAEIAIPFSDLHITPNPNTTWRLNFARIHYATPDDPKFASWSPMQEVNCHIPQNFGHLRFSTK